MRKPITVLALCAALAVPSEVPAADPAPLGGARPPARPSTRPTPHSADTDAALYERCMKMAQDDPGAARDLAEAWRSRGGAHPADHCYAVALIGLKQYKEAGARLETLGQAMTRAPAALRAEALAQAGQAWLLAGDPARAYAAVTAALAQQPDDPELLIDRAEAAGAAGWYDKAVDDLDRALRANPSRVDALVYRAAALREQSRLDLALADAEKAVKLDPGSAAALLERGNVRRLKGDVAGARQDWVRVSLLAPGSAQDAAAKGNIERLELRQDDSAAKPGRGR